MQCRRKSRNRADSFFLNNDTLLTPGWAEPLLSALRDEPELGAVGPLLLYANDTVQHLGVAYLPVGGVHLYRDFPRTHAVVARRRDLQCLTGAAIMLSADLFFHCGGFYEEYKNGYEDQDLCFHIRQAGKKLACIPESVVYHLEGQSVGRQDAEIHNRKIFRERCRQGIQIDFHTQGMRDGFAVFVNDLLSLSLCLPEEEEAALTLKAQEQPAPVWAKIMAENPYWRGGPDFFANLCERAGHYEQALMFRLQLANFHPTLERYLQVMELSHLFPQDSQWVISLQQNLAFMQLYRRDKQAAIRKLRAVQKLFSPENPVFFDKLYQDKLAEMFPSG